MAYTITTSDGSVVITIPDGQFNTQTSLTLPGPNAVGYGQFLDQNLLTLLENFASNSAPGGTNLQGQLWFNKSNQTLNVFTTSGYVSTSGLTLATLQPTNPLYSQTWFNTTTNQLSLYDGNNWNLIGPVYTKAQGVSGAIPTSVIDTVAQSHNILQLQYGNLVIATVSADNAFVPSPSMYGFPVINPGITISSAISSPTMNTNIVGALTGPVTGDVTGSVHNPISSTIAVDVTGATTKFIGNINGNVLATSIVTGALTSYGDVNINGNVSVPHLTVGNIYTANAVIAGGYINNIANITVGTTYTANLSTPNVIITSGTITGISNLSATVGVFSNTVITTSTASNFSTANAVITGGSITGDTYIGSTTGYHNNFSTANAQITGGNVSGLTLVSAANVTTGNVTTTTLAVTSGIIGNITSLTATNASFQNLTTANINITSGNIIATPIQNSPISGATLTGSFATTPTYSDNTTKIATTGFVQSVFPRGMIVMWNSTAASIPTGWQLCDGTNGTPDLRNQFVIGAGSAFSPGSTGGASSVSFALSSSNLPPHTHNYSGNISVSGNTSTQQAQITTSVTDPGHHHAYYESAITSGSSFVIGNSTIITQSQSTSTANTGISVSAIDLGHLHSYSATGSYSGNTTIVGSGTAVNLATVPPYYALCFIQKMF